MKRIKLTTEKLWAKNKYEIMAKGYQHYSKIKAMFREASSVADYYQIYIEIKALKELSYTVKGLITTFEHIWGYFKRSASQTEKEQFFELLKQVKGEDLSTELAQLTTYVLHLLKKYENDYLANSTILFSDLPWNEVTESKEIVLVTESTYEKHS